MRVFICEYVTSGGVRDKPLSEALLPEGTLIRDALLADVEELPGAVVLLAHDDRLPAPAADSVPVRAGDDVAAIWRALAASADVVWPVGPETEGILGRMLAFFDTGLRRVVGTAEPALSIASSKLATARHLAAAGIPCVPTVALADLPADWTFPLVTKPDHGAGCFEVRAWPDRSALPQAAGLVAQPFVPGAAASLTLLVRPDGVSLLAANHQHLREMVGVFCLSGLTVGAIADADGSLAALGRRVAEALPGLSGIVGVDLVLTADGPVVVEVNPRVTTAYAGLHAALGVNPAAFIPELTPAGRPPSLPLLPRARPVEVMIR